MQLKKEGKHVFWQFELLLPFKNVRHASFQKHGEPDPKTMGSAAWAKQVHGKEILAVAGEGYAGEGDGMATGERGIALCIQHADCQAALFYDPVRHVAGAVHCGWRGQTQKIYSEAIAAMERWYGSQAKDLLVCISPSLGPHASQFLNYERELPASFWAYQCKPFYFDLWQISKDELTAAGVRPGNIEIAEVCTLSNPDDYFSYRYDKTTKRLVTLISLL